MGNAQAQVAQLIAWWLVLSALAFAAAVWLGYFVLKRAIRDGIKESGLVQSWPRPMPPPRTDLGIPEMRADR